MSDSPKEKRSAAETWRALQGQAAEDEMDRILALSATELDRELEAAGLDPKAERERGEQLAEEARRGLVQLRARELESEARARALARPSSIVRRFPRRTMIAFAAAAAAAGLFAATRWILAPAPMARNVPEPEPTTSAPVPAGPSADELRGRAVEACNQFLWQRCLDFLDEAARVDPASDERPEVKKLRALAWDRMTPQEAGPPNDKPPRR
jgi:hypothetical protein